MLIAQARGLARLGVALLHRALLALDDIAVDQRPGKDHCQILDLSQAEAIGAPWSGGRPAVAPPRHGQDDW